VEENKRGFKHTRGEKGNGVRVTNGHHTKKTRTIKGKKGVRRKMEALVWAGETKRLLKIKFTGVGQCARRRSCRQRIIF